MFTNLKLPRQENLILIHVQFLGVDVSRKVLGVHLFMLFLPIAGDGPPPLVCCMKVLLLQNYGPSLYPKLSLCISEGFLTDAVLSIDIFLN